MKADFDSYLYIIITIVILIITALGKRRKKPVQQATGKPAPGRQVTMDDYQETADPYENADAGQMMSDPFERLQKLFVPGGTPFAMQEEEPEPEVEPGMEPTSEARKTEEMEKERELRPQKEVQKRPLSSTQHGPPP